MDTHHRVGNHRMASCRCRRHHPQHPTSTKLPHAISLSSHPRSLFLCWRHEVVHQAFPSLLLIPWKTHRASITQNVGKIKVSMIIATLTAFGLCQNASCKAKVCEWQLHGTWKPQPIKSSAVAVQGHFSSILQDLGLQRTHSLSVRHFEAARTLKLLLKGTDHPLTECVTEPFGVPVKHGQRNIVLCPTVSSASQWGLLG